MFNKSKKSLLSLQGTASLSLRGASLNERRSNPHDKGAALLTVLIALMIISLLTLELKYSAMLERKLAYNDLNQVQAYYLAKAGARMALLRVGMYGRAKRDPNIKKLSKDLPLDRYIDMIWNLPLPPFPPPSNKEELSKLDKADKDAAEKILDETRITDGRFSHSITSESSKINLNFLDLKYVPEAQKGQTINFRSDEYQNIVQYTGRSLINLMDDFIKNSEDPNEEFGNLKPEEIVVNIMEWVNASSSLPNKSTSAFFYDQQKPPYKIKHGHFFTVEELRMVAGIDSHLFDLLKPHVTVYSDDGKININTAKNAVLKAIYPDFNDDDLKRIAEEKSKRGGFWSTEKEFVEYVTRELNRASFGRMYDEKDYPFTVGNRSFIIESLGVLQRGKTEIQKVIKIAVSLQAGQGGTVDPTIVDQATCDSKPGKFWYRVEGRCRNKPTNKDQCVGLAGTWAAAPNDANKMCCNINNQPPICPEKREGPEEPNQMKVKSWSES